jgi:exodeoxyribonuclease VII large subunit
VSSQNPPDWALPAWDAVPDETGGRTASSGRQPTAPGTFGLRILRVSDVTRAIRENVRSDERLRDLWVEGEVGRVTISSAGHAYFALKDDRNQLQCVWFRDDRLRSAFEPQAGLRIVVHGRIDLFEPQGALQLYVESIQPSGFGDLALRFEALKARLAAEGLFDLARKRPLPARPPTIAVITSPTGAVWRDISHVLARRWPLVRVVLVPCQVQGDGAPGSIVTAFRRLERFIHERQVAADIEGTPTVTILARGGGSLEDLWPFNDERVVRAVVAHTVPVVCGVGHEVDVTLADFAADVRAPTPSAAAEIVVPDRAEFAAALRRALDRLNAGATRALASATREVEIERRGLERVSPAGQLVAARERAGVLLDRATRIVAGQIAQAEREEERLSTRLQAVLPARLAGHRASLQAAEAALVALGPQATLDRGYSIVRRRSDEAVVRRPAEAPAGEALRLTVAEGEIAARSEGPAPGDVSRT